MLYYLIIFYVVLLSWWRNKDVYCTWDLRFHFARHEATLKTQVGILWLWNLENDTAVLRRWYVMSPNWSSGWLKCNMGCSSQPLMKLTPVNGVNVCEIVSVPEMNVFHTFFNFWTIYQVSGLQQVSATNTTVTFWEWWTRLLHKLYGVCHKIILWTFLRYLHSVVHIGLLHKNEVNYHCDIFIASII